MFQDLKGKAALTPREDCRRLDARDRQDADRLGMRAAHRPRAERARTAAARRRRRWSAQMGPKAADARALAYRLFEIATQEGLGGGGAGLQRTRRRNGRSWKTWRRRSARRPSAGAQADMFELSRRTA